MELKDRIIIRSLIERFEMTLLALKALTQKDTAGQKYINETQKLLKEYKQVLLENGD